MKGITQMIEAYGREFEPSEDMNFVEAMEIIEKSRSKMELVGNGYLFGYMRGSQKNKSQRMVPLYNIRQMSDDEWNHLAAKNKAEREAVLC